MRIGCETVRQSLSECCLTDTHASFLDYYSYLDILFAIYWKSNSAIRDLIILQNVAIV